VTRALLIDDEKLSRVELRRLLGAHPDVTIVGEANGVPSGRARLATADYDLVFLDIQLTDGSGFDLVPHVAPTARIIFVTAHDRFALRAFEVNALDYLLKPVSPARLAEALRRLPPAGSDAQLPAAPQPGEGGSTLSPQLPSLATDDRVFLKNERGARFVPLADIAAVISSDNYSEVFVTDGAHFLVRRSLKLWESALPADAFVRVHRQAIVNLAKIERIDALDSDTPTLWLQGVKQPMPCSYRFSPELRRLLQPRA
jgi:two-component system LytT family response regulator